MYRFVHWLKNRVPFLWELVEIFNSFIFGILYQKKLNTISDVISGFCGDYELREAAPEDLDRIVSFFDEQPIEQPKVSFVGQTNVNEPSNQVVPNFIPPVN